MTIQQALTIASPRYTPRPVPLLSTLIYSSVVFLWIAVALGAWRFSGLWAWAIGLVYISYDTALLLYVGYKTYDLMRPVPAPPSTPIKLSQNRPTLGVVVAARNEASVLPITVRALLAQTDAPEHILIVDDGSRDDTASLLTSQFELVWQADNPSLGQSARHPALQLLRRPHAGKARSLNASLSILTTDLVVTVDADTILRPDAIAGIRHAFMIEPNLVAAGGVLTPICINGITGRFFQWFQTYEYIRNFISRIAWMRAGALLLVSGAFAGFRRDALMIVGGFDADCFVEDYELIHRLHRWSFEHGLNWRVRVLGNARGTTDAPASLPAFLRQRRRWFAGFLQTQFWNRDMTGNPRFGKLGRVMLPVKAIDTLQPVYGLTAFLLLLFFIVTGRLTIILPVALVIGAKIVLDLGFHLWSVRLYSSWIGEKTTSGRIGMAALAALIEPFSFQLLRHTGATLGWVSFLTRRLSWGTVRQ